MATIEYYQETAYGLANAAIPDNVQWSWKVILDISLISENVHCLKNDTTLASGYYQWWAGHHTWAAG